MDQTTVEGAMDQGAFKGAMNGSEHLKECT